MDDLQFAFVAARERRILVDIFLVGLGKQVGEILGVARVVSDVLAARARLISTCADAKLSTVLSAYIFDSQLRTSFASNTSTTTDVFRVLLNAEDFTTCGSCLSFGMPELNEIPVRGVISLFVHRPPRKVKV